MLEGPTVLGWDTWHELDERYAFGTVKAVLAVAAEWVESRPSRSIRSRISWSVRSCRPAWSWPEPTTPWRPSGRWSRRREPRVVDLSGPRPVAGVAWSTRLAPTREARRATRRSTQPWTVTAVARRFARQHSGEGDLERRPGDGADDERDVDFVVEAQGLRYGPKTSSTGNSRLRPRASIAGVRTVPRRRGGRWSGGIRPGPPRGRAGRPRGGSRPWRRSRRSGSAGDGRRVIGRVS